MRQACLRSEVRRLHAVTCFFRLLSRDRRIKGLLLCALLLISYNNFACSTMQYTASHSDPGWSCAVVAARHTLPRCCSVLEQVRSCALLLTSYNNFACSTVQYTADHSNAGWSCAVATRLLCCCNLAHSSKEMLRCPGNQCDRALCS